MRLLRSTPAIVASLTFVALLTPISASASSSGITGQSGKQGTTCSQLVCHFGGVEPQVRFEQVSPAGAIEPGAIVTFRFVVQSSDIAKQVAAGFNVAASDGTLATVAEDGGVRRVTAANELTHRSPRDNDANGVSSFQFSWTAPTTAGTYTLFGAGNSVNNKHSVAGDNSKATTLSVPVGIVAPTATNTPENTATATATPPSTPTQTATPSIPGPTATAAATPTTGTPTACTGDCNSSSDVTVDEIVTGVNIALGTVAVTACEPFDRDGNGAVTVDELVEAIQRALNGCAR